MRIRFLSSDRLVVTRIRLFSGLYFNALISRFINMVVHFSLSKQRVSTSGPGLYKMEMPFNWASGLKSVISCSIHGVNSTVPTFRVLCPTSILRTSSTIFRRFFMRPDCLLMLWITGYLSSSGDSDSSNCFNGACIRVSGVRNSWLILIRKRTFSS